MAATCLFVRSALAVGLVLAACDGAVAKRIALVIGNDAYLHLPRLEKAVGDAQAVKDALERLGFTVTLAKNLDFRTFTTTVSRFTATVAQGDEVVLHYSGHGVAIDGRNFLVPVDLEEPEPGQEAQIADFTRDAGRTVEVLRGKSPKYLFVILDACRNNPFKGTARSVVGERGLKRMDARTGAFILFSAGEGETALDRLGSADSSTTSVFTRVLLKHLETPGLTLQKIAKATQGEVRDLAATVNHEQFPDYSDRTTDEPILKEAAIVALPKPPLDEPQKNVLAKENNTLVDPDPVVTTGKDDARNERPQDGSVDLAHLTALLDGSDAKLEEFIRTYPDDPRAKEVKELMEMRRDIDAFERAMDTNTPEAWQAYKSRPGARRASDADAAIARLSAPPSSETPPEADTTTTLVTKPSTSLTTPSAPGTLTPDAAGEVAPLSALRPGGYIRGNFETDDINSVAASPVADVFATGSQDGSVILWSETAPKVLGRHARAVQTVAFSPDGRILASGGQDSVVRLWDVASGRMVRALNVHLDHVNAVAFSPDGKTLASASDDKTIRLSQTATGALLKTISGSPSWLTSVAFSPDGTMVAAGNSEGVSIWDVRSTALRRTLEGPSVRGVRTLAYSADGSLLATGDTSGSVALWNTKTARLFKALKSHTATVSSVAFSRDGTRLATAGNDTTVRVWDIPALRAQTTSEPAQMLAGHEDRISSVAFSADGTSFVSGAYRDGLRIWNVRLGKAARVRLLPNSEWVAIGDVGYVASSGAHPYLRLHRNGSETPVDDAFKQRWLKPMPSAAVAKP